MPAQKRPRNERAKARSTAAHVRLRERRERLRVLRLAAEFRNRALRAQGLPTPWEARVGPEAVERMKAAEAKSRADRAEMRRLNVPVLSKSVVRRLAVMRGEDL